MTTRERVRRLQLLNDAVGYKPGWVIEFNQPLEWCDTPDDVVISLVATVPDVRSGQRSQIAAKRSLPGRLFDDMHDAEILRIVRQMIEERELHEIDEFFTFYGTQVNDPHPELKMEARILSYGNIVSRDTPRKATVHLSDEVSHPLSRVSGRGEQVAPTPEGK